MRSEPARTEKAAQPVSGQQDLCIDGRFESQACATPEAIAVSDGEARLSYAELNSRANHLAHHLRDLGVGPEVPVALFLERSHEMVVAILGVLKAGGAYVPVDLAYPSERFAFMLEDTKAPVILTQRHLVEAIPLTGARVICLDGLKFDARGKANAHQPLASHHPANAAYIIYTSGSTGTPKGVVVTHHNVTRLLTNTEHWYQFNNTDVWPLFHSYAFDVSVWELWGALFYGGRLVIVPYLTSRSPHDFYDLLAREKVTVLNQTPSAFRQLIWAETTSETKLPLALRYVICAGETLELQSLKPWFDLHGDERPQVVNKYGITEITVHATYRVIRSADLTSGAGSVIGVPIPDLQIYLVDKSMKPVPPGAPGEICVGGAGVARSYLNRPELTSQRFLPDPFSGQPGARLYRSGDLAQVSAQGEMEYLGRIDHQVKIRGFRVELGEIESTLNRHASIRESVVLAQDGTAGDKRLIAYVVPRLSQPTVTELREHLRRTMPDYMVPAAFVFLKSLPLTTNGKVDRRALPAPGGTRPRLQTELVLPRTSAERLLAEIWSEVLEIEPIGIHDNFFELGGDSIRSIIILSKAEQNGLRLSLQQIFQSPTVAGLASCAETLGSAVETRSTEPFSLISAEDRQKLPADIVDAYPLGRLQMGMFFHNELDTASAVYHDVFSFHVGVGLDEERLDRALGRLVERHPIMRTSFHLTGFSEPLQLVHRSARIPLTSEDLRAASPQQQEQKLVGWVEREKRNAFDRSVAPLVRFHALRLGEDSFQLIISFHHACLDGWSLAAVITEILQDYSCSSPNSAQASPGPRAGYRDFIRLERESIRSETERKFWSAKLRDATTQTLSRWPQEMREGGHEQKRGPELKVPAQVLAGLKDLARRAGAPLKTVLLAAHQRVMSLLTGQSDVTSGLLCNGRPEVVDGEKIAGLFLNTLPVRQQLSGGTWIELITETFAAEQELLPHRRFPLAEIQKCNGGQPPFEVGFDFVHFHVYNRLQGAGLDFAEGHYFEANDLTAFTTFMLDVSSEQLQMHIDYDPNALCREQVEQFSNYYLATLQAMVAEPEGSYELFSPLSAAEKRQILCEWNATQAEYPRTKCLHELFELQANQTPEAVALAFDGEEFTYAELNRRADQISDGLREAGLGAGDLAAICMERGAEMVVGLLAILKTGAAYVPLDPTQPPERLALMLEDARPGVVLTQRFLLEGLPKTDRQVLYIESLANAASSPQGNGSINLRPAICAQDSDSLAYVIFTSGSTGKPKAVQVLHRAVVNLVTSAAKTIGFGKPDNLLAVTTLSFDIAALELFLPLISGAKLTLASRHTASDGTQLAALLESSGATVMQGTPATWRLLIESGWEGSPGLRALCGGEALARNLADELLKRAEKVWNFYGPTETTIWSTAWRVTAGAPIVIGRPFANTQLYILDERLQPLPVGVVGELHIGGDGLARGYLNRPELTAQKFIPHPFATRAGERLYKTGDLARWLPNGEVECLGRTDHQVKIRGFRIEPGEVETVLRQHSGIADALVTAAPDNVGEKRLIGYVISKNGPPSTAELREFVRSRLPHYMVPAQFVTLKEFPRGPNGKIDPRRLPAPGGQSEPAKSQLAPRTDDEKSLVAIWQEVLMINKIGVEDNFFDLGGDSLSATRAFARANQVFGSCLTLREMFDHPTIAAFAARLRQPAHPPVRAAPIRPRRERTALAPVGS